jgi:hypothetical protein
MEEDTFIEISYFVLMWASKASPTSTSLLQLSPDVWYLIVKKLDYTSCVRLLKCTCENLQHFSMTSCVREIVDTKRSQATIFVCSFRPYNWELNISFWDEWISFYIRLESLGSRLASEIVSALAKLEKDPQTITILDEPLILGTSAIWWHRGRLVYIPTFFTHGLNSTLISLPLEKMIIMLEEYVKSFDGEVRSLYFYRDGKIQKDIAEYEE